MTKLDRATIKHILVERKFDLSARVWQEKETIIFNMKAKYGKAFDCDMARDIYDKIKEEEEKTRKKIEPS